MKTSIKGTVARVTPDGKAAVIKLSIPWNNRILAVIDRKSKVSAGLTRNQGKLVSGTLVLVVSLKDIKMTHPDSRERMTVSRILEIEPVREKLKK